MLTLGEATQALLDRLQIVRHLARLSAPNQLVRQRRPTTELVRKMFDVGLPGESRRRLVRGMSGIVSFRLGRGHGLITT
jgi:hypothetical protein